MAHVAGQADAAGHTAKADSDLEQLRLLGNDLTGLHAAASHHNSELNICQAGCSAVLHTSLCSAEVHDLDWM